jgi:lipopolysaccharide assembly LptE-like protein
MLRTVSIGLIAASLGLLAGCAGDGHINIFGYTTAPPYDETIRTVYVPIFENVSFRRGLEFDLTRVVIREIEAKTPYKVASCRERADTELLGKIVARRKALINQNQLGEVREAEVSMVVELQWRDLRPGHYGEFLSHADDQRKDDPLAKDSLAREPRDLARKNDPFARQAKDSNTIVVQPTGHFIPELGGSVTSAEKQIIDRLAVQIVSLMERPW